MCVPIYKNMGERLLQNIFPLHNIKNKRDGECALYVVFLFLQGIASL